MINKKYYHTDLSLYMSDPKNFEIEQYQITCIKYEGKNGGKDLGNYWVTLRSLININRTIELPIPVSDDKLIFDSKALEEKLYEKLIFLDINSAQLVLNQFISSKIEGLEAKIEDIEQTIELHKTNIKQITK